MHPTSFNSISIRPCAIRRADNQRRAWQEFFAVHTGPITYEVRELNVTTQGELAFVHSINHVSGTLASGHSSDTWVRWSFGPFHALFKSRASR